MTQNTRIAVIAIVMTLLLVGMVTKKQYTLNTGALIELKTQPIDPRSLFRGDYVRLSYAINRLEVAAYPVLKSMNNHDEVFVTLTNKGALWEAVSVSDTYPEHKPGDVVIRGEINQSARMRRAMGDLVPVRYGIENYFVAEDEGQVLEGLRNQQKVSLQIAVDHFGNAGIKAVLVDHKPLYIETLF